MKYWGYLAAKLAAGAGLAYAIAWAIYYCYLPQSADAFAYDLTFRLLMLGHFLLCLGLLYIVVRDQRYRCRTCLRRLRMPIARGSWTHILLGPPRTEYICPYGHGTLNVSELHIGGPHPPDWQEHEDIWKELFSNQETKR
jgi:hypothetical protein